VENKNIAAFVFVVIAITSMIIMVFPEKNSTTGSASLFYGNPQPKVYGGAIQKYEQNKRFILEGSAYNPYAQKTATAGDFAQMAANSKYAVNFNGPLSEFDAQQKIKEGYQVIYDAERGGYFYNSIKILN